MEVFTYTYHCKTWYNKVKGIRNVYVESGVDVLPEEAAKKDAEVATGSSECDIQLLQRFRMVVSDVEAFPAMAAQPLYKYSKK